MEKERKPVERGKEAEISEKKSARKFFLGKPKKQLTNKGGGEEREKGSQGLRLVSLTSGHSQRGFRSKVLLRAVLVQGDPVREKKVEGRK